MPIKMTSIKPKLSEVVNKTQLITDSRKNMQQYLEEVRDKVAVYPPKSPKNPNHSYQRTHVLEDGWYDENAIQVSADGQTGTLTNDVWYAVYVNGPRGGGRGIGQRQTQALRDKGWKSITDVANATRKRYVELMNRAYSGSSPGRPGRLV